MEWLNLVGALAIAVGIWRGGGKDLERVGGRGG